MEVLERYQDALRPDWLVFVILGLLVLLALVRTFGREQLMVIARSVTRPRVPRLEVREQTDILDVGYLGLWAISIFSIGLFIFQQLVVHVGYPSDLSPFRNYLMLCAFIGGYFIAKYIFIKLSMFLIGEDLGGSEYFYNTFMLFSVAGVALLPLIVLQSYVQFLPAMITAIGIAILGLTILYQWVRGWIIAVGNGGSAIYIFLYFCMLEILPFALLARLVVDATAAH